MAEYATAPGTAPSQWRDSTLEDPSSTIVLAGQRTLPEVFGRYGKKDEVSESTYRNGPFRSDFEHPTEGLGGFDHTSEPYRSAEFRAPVYCSGDYNWPNSTTAPRQGSISPKAPHSQSSEDLENDRTRRRSSDDSITLQEQEDADMLAMENGDLDDDSETPQSAEDRRYEKRKMKRFRLTHNQTRFLMSEFARQAHPDAAHRERLSQEIPGLSPRQVQVWFQNRRAKLKRMSSEDRERMMRSRAVPENFNIAQTLQTPYGRATANYLPTSMGGGHIRPPAIDTLRVRTDDDSIPPLSSTSSYGYFSTPPASATDLMSPMSFTSERTCASYQSASSYSSGPRTSNPFYRSSMAPELMNLPSQPLSRIQQLDCKPRTLSEPLPAPMKSASPYSSEFPDYQLGTGPQSAHGMQYVDPPRSYSTPYMPGYSSNYSQPYPSPSSTQPRSCLSGLPPITSSPVEQTIQAAQTSGFHTAPLAASEGFQLPQMTATSDGNYNNSYIPRSSTDATGQLTPLSMAGSSHSGKSVVDDIILHGNNMRNGYGHNRTRSSPHLSTFTSPQLN